MSYNSRSGLIYLIFWVLTLDGKNKSSSCYNFIWWKTGFLDDFPKLSNSSTLAVLSILILQSQEIGFWISDVYNFVNGNTWLLIALIVSFIHFKHTVWKLILHIWLNLQNLVLCRTSLSGFIISFIDFNASCILSWTSVGLVDFVLKTLFFDKSFVVGHSIVLQLQLRYGSRRRM